MAKQIDFTQGNLTKQIVLFSVPLVLGELLQNLYNSVDSFVVGNLVSDTALAAISVSSNLINLLIGFFSGMSIGSIVVLSKVYGSKQSQKLNSYIQVAYTFSAVLGIILSVIGYSLANTLVNLTAMPDDVYAEAIIYLRIYLSGLAFTVVYNISAGILRAIGDSRTPFVVLLITSCINIVLDLVFVITFDFGIAGVSLATVLSQFLSVAIVSYKICQQTRVSCFSLARLLQDGKPVILDLLRIGAPSGIQNSLITFSNLFIWRYVNYFGSTATAGIGIAQRLDKFIAMPCKAIGTTTTACISQNLGAKNHDRAKVGCVRCMLLSLSILGVMEIFGFLFASQCVALFNDNPTIIQIGVSMLRVIMPFYLFFALREVLYGVLRGHGFTQITTMLSLIGMIAIRQLFLAVSMNRHPVISNIYFCYPIAWCSTLLLIFLYYVFLSGRGLLWGQQAKLEENV